MNRSARITLTVLLGALGAASAACSTTLETGYKPRPVGVSSTERRGYYASPYTPEAAAAAQTRTDTAADFNSQRRPGISGN